MSNPTNDYDVIIIGAGPGGLSCARHLAGSTKKVLVLEKSAGLGEKICLGLISAKVFPDEPRSRGIPWTEISVATRGTKQLLKFDRPY
jgi:flavin-dependent dehydrogenase